MKRNAILSILGSLFLVCLLFSGCGKTETPSKETQGSGNAVPAVSEENDAAVKFSFSGGTGKVGISCGAINKNGSDYTATIIFDSDAYTYIRVGDEKYNCDHGEGTSYAEIPVQINANNTIYAETTKMSQAHEIEYTLFIYEDSEERGQDLYALLKTNTLDESAPFIPGLEAAREEASESGEQYKVFDYENGVRVLEVQLKKTEDASLDSFDYAAYTGKAQTVEDAQANLYMKNVVKYILAPEGTELPAGIEKEAIVIKVPLVSILTGSADISPKELVRGDYDAVMIEIDTVSSDPDAFESFSSDAAGLGIPVIVNSGFEETMFQ
ncbi:MAG: hypothetical protein IKE48_04395 [Parasporobacterium sp.]|nr:hypothetical protein [Parasporobacterium sp.]